MTVVDEFAHAEVPCLVTADYLHHLWEDRKARFREYNRVGRRVRDVLSNSYQEGWRDVVAAGEEPVVANLIKAASRAITQKAAHYPRITAEVMSSRKRTSNAAAQRADAHQEQLGNDLKKIGFRATHTQAVHWLVNHDMAVFQLLPSPYYGCPLVRARDPLTTFPGSVWPHKPDVFDVLFAERKPAFQAIRIYPQIASMLTEMDARESNKEVVLGEYVDETGMVVALLEPMCQIVDWLPSLIPGQPTVFIGRTFTDDGDYHGQFDHSIPTLIAQAKMGGLIMKLAEHNVFSEVNVYGELLGSQPTYKIGPGAVNFLTPGSKVEKSINTMSPQVFQEMDRYERAIRMDAGFPGQLSGEPVATIATGKGLEELQVTVDENVNYIQTVDADTLIRLFTVYPEMARAMKSPGFDNYQPKGTLFVGIRFQSGDDPATLIGQLQKLDAGLLARQTIRERMDEVVDAEVEARLVDAEAIRQAIIKGIEAQLTQPAGTPGGMDPLDGAKLIKWRNEGIALEDAVQRLAQEKQTAAVQALPSAQGGGPPSITDMLTQARGGGPPPLTLGAARTAERMMSAAPFQATAAQTAAGREVQRQMGGPPALPAGVPPV